MGADSQLSRRYGLSWVAVLAIGCSSPKALTNGCVPLVDCTAIDTIEPPSNCGTCPTCTNSWGACDPGGPACKRGALDLDPVAPGCESATSDAHAQWVMHSSDDPISFFSINGGPATSVEMNVSAVAFEEEDPSCIPTSTERCAYSIFALQLEIADFSVPESSWTNGVATLNGPIPAADNGTGIGLQAPMLFAFDVQQGQKQKIALSSASADVGIFHSADDPGTGAILIQVGSIDFGGYQISHFLFNGTLSSAPAAQ
jgi:hypothetical protein